MKILKILAFAYIALFSCNAYSVNMFELKEKRINQKDYLEPVYEYVIKKSFFDDEFILQLLAEKDNFPFTSKKQGSVFFEIFNHLADKEHIIIYLAHPNNITFKEVEQLMEHEDGEKFFDGIFGMYYEENKYSSLQYLYPAFAENHIHLITNSSKTLDINTKEDLKKYKGLYVKTDFLPKFAIKDAKRLGLTESADFGHAFEDLFTGRVDFIVASNYLSQIELYKVGLRAYARYSQNPIWSAPLFLKFPPKTMKHPRLESLKKYFKSAEYKQVRDKAFENLLERYRENTKGIVPPTYMNTYQSLINQ